MYNSFCVDVKNVMCLSVFFCVFLCFSPDFFCKFKSCFDDLLLSFHSWLLSFHLQQFHRLLLSFFTFHSSKEKFARKLKSVEGSKKESGRSQENMRKSSGHLRIMNEWWDGITFSSFLPFVSVKFTFSFQCIFDSKITRHVVSGGEKTRNYYYYSFTF